MKAHAPLLSLLASASAFGHGGESHLEVPAPGPANWTELWRAWELDWFVVLPLLLTLAIYVIGVEQTWRAAGTGHGVRRLHVALFCGGWLTLALALVSPLHTWGGVLFSVHMTQHEVLMLVSAPLLVLAQPLVPFLRALPLPMARGLARQAKRPPLSLLWRVLTTALVAWALHAVVLWVWHVPVLFEATFTSDFMHALQHLSFLLSALVFWWAVVHGPQRAMGYGLAVLYMFSTALHSGLLGALITLATSPWYPSYEGRTEAWGLSPLEDQQLGGLIMWVPACTVYIFAGLALFAAWLRGSEARVRRWEAELDLLPAVERQP
jgi:putative membrane protein